MALELTVVTPEGQAFHGEIEDVVLPGTEGDFGVLLGHEVFMTGLRIGEMKIDRPGETLYAAVSRGFAEVHGETVTVMVGTCEFAHEIDSGRAEIARERSMNQLEEMRATPDGEKAYQDYQDSYTRAVARISVSERFKN